MTAVLRAVARCETAVEDSTNVLCQKMDDILQKLNYMKNVQPPSKDEEFSSVSKVLPIGTQEDFNRLNDRLDLDVHFHDLMVSMILCGKIIFS